MRREKLICGGAPSAPLAEERMVWMQGERHGLNAVPLEYMPRPADREIRTRIERVDISVRGGKNLPESGEEVHS